MGIYAKLGTIQSRLSVPKNQRNNFGNYNYRSCEDITEAVKPYLKELNCALLMRDEIELVGDRFYVKATATLYDTETGENVEVNAFAREPLQKRGMDDSQITGATSSYARKYALNGLFALDDNKDADTDEARRQADAAPAPRRPAQRAAASGNTPVTQQAPKAAAAPAKRDPVPNVPLKPVTIDAGFEGDDMADDDLPF